MCDIINKFFKKIFFIIILNTPIIIVRETFPPFQSEFFSPTQKSFYGNFMITNRINSFLVLNFLKSVRNKPSKTNLSHHDKLKWSF